MRELSVAEIGEVVGGTNPMWDKTKPTQPWDLLTEGFFDSGFAVVGLNWWDDVKDTVNKVIEKLFPDTEADSRKQFMDHCASQGKSAVFKNGGGGFELQANPGQKTVTIKGSTGSSESYCQ